TVAKSERREGGKDVVTFSYKAFVRELVIKAEREYRGVDIDFGEGRGGVEWDKEGEGWSGVLSARGWGKVFEECNGLTALSLC
ncbi:hypothetical protein HK097_006510, partial [Rhizophlyctis rosea]